VKCDDRVVDHFGRFVSLLLGGCVGAREGRSSYTCEIRDLPVISLLCIYINSFFCTGDCGRVVVKCND